MQFEFAVAGRIIFGDGAIRELPRVAAALGHHPLLVLGKSAERMSPHREALTQAGLSVTSAQIPSEPDVATISRWVAATRDAGCDMIIAIGGGSVLDGGKAIAALVPNQGEITDYLEVVGKGRTLEQPALPFVAVPTTAGTGSETTRNAVLSVPDQKVKASLRHASMLPRVAIVDPQLTYSASPALTASTGMDALAQLIEPFTCIAPNPTVDAFCRDGMGRIARSIRRAWREGEDAEARADLSLAALWSGMALANAKLGAVHGLAAPIGGRFAVAHGALCAALLPHVVRTNLLALRRGGLQPDLQGRYSEVARILSGRMDAIADDAAPWLGDLCSELRIQPLHHYGVSPADFTDLVGAARQSSSMKGNPVVLTDEELYSILEAAL